jgi:hypothetical protein
MGVGRFDHLCSANIVRDFLFDIDLADSGPGQRATSIRVGALEGRYHPSGNGTLREMGESLCVENHRKFVPLAR